MEAIEKPESKIDLVLRELRRHINKSGVGEKLPPIRTLEKDLGVSRITLSSALNILKSDGFIHSRHGSGYYVADPPARSSAVIGVAYPTPPISGGADLEKLYLNRCMEGMQSVLPECSFRLFTTPEAISDLPSRTLDCCACLILKAHQCPASAVRRLRRQGMTLICAGNIVCEELIHSLRPDYELYRDVRSSAGEIFRVFAAAGHRELGFIFAIPAEMDLLEEGYQKAFGRKIERSNFWCALDEKGSYDFSLVENILRRKGRPAAFLLSDHYAAASFTSACLRLGLRIPEDISVAALCGYEVKPLMRLTAACPEETFFAMGKKAAEIIASRQRGGASPIPKKTYFAEKITLGNSIREMNRQGFA